MNDQATVGILVQIRADLAESWRRLPNKGFFCLLATVWLALFAFLGNSTFGYIDTNSLFHWMYNAYIHKGPASDDQVGFLIPFIVLALFWWKRDQLLALPMKIWWPGLLLVAAGLVLHLIGYVVQQPRISIVAMFTGLYGLMGVAWGYQWMRASFFPFFLFGFCVPLGSLAEPITFRLQMLVCTLVEWICHMVLAIDIVRVGAQLLDPTENYKYEVAAACSGIRSLIATLLIATIYAFVAFGRWWKRGVMIASAFPLAVLGNLVRMLFIILAAEMGGAKGQEWGNFVHENGFFSLVPYIPAIGGLVVLARWLDEPPAAKGASSPLPRLRDGGEGEEAGRGAPVGDPSTISHQPSTSPAAERPVAP